MTPEQIAADIMDSACLGEPYVRNGVDAALRKDIAAAIREEHKRLRAILGFDVVTEEEVDGHKVNMCHDPYYDLEGAVIDLERQKANAGCIRTIKRHQTKLIAFEKATEFKQQENPAP